jgi:hypothetical protein
MEGVVYDIPLEEEEEEIKPVITHTAEMERASLVNGNEWHERYKNAMGNAIRVCIGDIGREWKNGNQLALTNGFSYVKKPETYLETML